VWGTFARTVRAVGESDESDESEGADEFDGASEVDDE
jgi:hypothetical protein